MFDRVPRFVFGDRRVGSLSHAEVSECREPAGMLRIAVISVNDVTAGAAGHAVIARIIVGPRHGEQRIEQARLLQPLKYRVGSQTSAQTAVAELHIRSARQFKNIRAADIRRKAFEFTASLKNPQDISGLCDLPTRQRREKWQDALHQSLFRRRLRIGEDHLNRAAGAVAFAKMSVLVWKGAVVVERCTPQHTAVSHHALLRPDNLFRVAFAAGQIGGTEISGIDETHELIALLEPHGIEPLRISSRVPEFRKTRLNVCLLFILRFIRIAAVTVSTSYVQIIVSIDVHRFRILVADNAADAARIDLALPRLSLLLSQAVVGISGCSRVDREHAHSDCQYQAREQ